MVRLLRLAGPVRGETTARNAAAAAAVGAVAGAGEAVLRALKAFLVEGRGQTLAGRHP